MEQTQKPISPLKLGCLLLPMSLEVVAAIMVADIIFFYGVDVFPRGSPSAWGYWLAGSLGLMPHVVHVALIRISFLPEDQNQLRLKKQWVIWSYVSVVAIGIAVRFCISLAQGKAQ